MSIVLTCDTCRRACVSIFVCSRRYARLHKLASQIEDQLASLSGSSEPEAGPPRVSCCLVNVSGMTVNEPTSPVSLDPTCVREHLHACVRACVRAWMSGRASGALCILLLSDRPGSLGTSAADFSASSSSAASGTLPSRRFAQCPGKRKTPFLSGRSVQCVGFQ